MTMQEFWDARSEWSQATFGRTAERGPMGPAKHVVKECGELKAAMGDRDEFLKELVDVEFLIQDIAERGGFQLSDLETPMEALINVIKNYGKMASEPVNPAGVLLCVRFMRLFREVICDRVGVSEDVFLQLLEHKLEVNRARKWPARSAADAVEHIRE
jgi:hypothetical protein